MRIYFGFNSSLVLRTPLVILGSDVGILLRADLYAVDPLGLYFVLNFIVR
jgi:hypothetical protein